MKVSVIIPVYNVYQYLRTCVESAQKLKTNIEIILVDDGSKDNSGALCDELSAMDPRIRVVHQENGGLSKARNTGIENSTGDYVMFIDSDDFVDPEITDDMLSRLDSGPDILMGLYRNYYSKDDHYENEACDGFLSVDGNMPIDRYLMAVPADGTNSYMVAVRFVVRRDFLLQHELFFTQGIYHEDEEWTQRLLCNADNITVTHDYFYQYRQAREGAITSSVKPKHVWDIFTIMEHSEQLLHRQQPGSAKATYLKNRMAQLYVSNMINVGVLEKKDKATAYQKLKKYRNLCNDSFSGGIGKCIKLCQNIFGIRITCDLLKIVRAILKGKR